MSQPTSQAIGDDAVLEEVQSAGPGGGEQDAVAVEAHDVDASGVPAPAGEPAHDPTAPEAAVPDGDAPAAPEPVAEALLAPLDEPVTEEPVAEGPTAEEPTADDPTADDPTVAAVEAHDVDASGVPAPAGEPAQDPTAPAVVDSPAAPGARPTPAVLAARRPAPRPPALPAADADGSPDGGAPSAGPAARASRPAAPLVPVRPPSDPTPWGRVDEQGAVYVGVGEAERQVGSVVDATPEEALAHYGRRYDELVAQVDLVEQRLMAGGVAPADAVGSLRALRSSLPTAEVVGDLDGLAQRTRDLEAIAAERRRQADAERAAAKEEVRAARTALVEEAEAIAATDPTRMQWRPSGDRLRVLLETWKEQQRAGTKLDKRGEDELWKRFSAARTTFDRARRAHFSALEATNAEAKAAKERLVAEAEALAGSTDWGPTASAYRQLMDRWRAAGHASRKDDDALWARFRAAQDGFFAARHAASAVEDEEYAKNLVVKEALLTEAEALLPVRDHRAAKAALRGIGERWEAAGKVPRADVSRVERRLRAVEQAVADAERDTWRRSNPETRARAEGAVGQLERAVADLRSRLERAEASGDERAAADARAALEARQGWLDAARRTAEEFSG